MPPTLLLSVLILASCASDPVMSKGEVLLPGDLNQRKEALDGSFVRVRGYLVHEPEDYTVWDSPKAEADGTDISKCISLLYPVSLRSRIVDANRKTVVLEGVFRRNVTSPGLLQLGLCNYTGIEVRGLYEP